MNEFPLIVDIKRHSLEDGPGIRSAVFFKGCPLRCIFCQNPETQDPGIEIAFYARKCIRCGSCAVACLQGAVDLELPGHIHRDKCIRCGSCAEVCPGNALSRIGAYYPVEELTEILLRDSPYYHYSGGGVTLSGGEPTLYPDYVESLLGTLKAKAVHVALETSGCFDYPSFQQKLLPYIDLIYYDLKLADPRLHRKYLGVSNESILNNLRLLWRQKKVAIHPRIPLIPGITATRENLQALVDFLVELGTGTVSLLPYNPLGLEMYPNLGKPNPPLPENFMKPEEEKELQALFRSIIEEKYIKCS